MYCKQCGTELPNDVNVCSNCGTSQVDVKPEQPQIIINNTNSNQNIVGGIPRGHIKNKWVAFLLCLFLGFIGAHKFYEGKVGMGVLYIFTFGLFTIGWIVDLVILLTKPTKYYIYK